MDPNSLTDLLNAPPPGFVWNGKTYHVADLTVGQRAEFERWLKDRAIAAAGVAPEGAPDDYMQPFRQGTIQDIAAGVYSWGSPACVRATQGRDGGVKVLHLAIGAQDDTFTLQDAESLWDSEFARIVKDLTARAVSDPPA